MAYNSGREGVTNTFISTAWYAAVLSSLSKTQPISHSVYCRQALIGGHYELISHESMDPNPDYWMARLWKRLVGRKAIGPIDSSVRKDSLETAKAFSFGCCYNPGNDELLVHAFCAKAEDGDVVFVVINVAKSATHHLNITLGSSRTEYILTPQKNQWNSKRVLLNGIGPLSIRDNGSAAVTLDGYYSSDPHKTLGIPPKSVSFVVVHEADVKNCYRQPHPSDQDTALNKSGSSVSQMMINNVTKNEHGGTTYNESTAMHHQATKMKHAESSNTNYLIFQETSSTSVLLMVGFLTLFVAIRRSFRRD